MNANLFRLAVCLITVSTAAQPLPCSFQTDNKLSEQNKRAILDDILADDVSLKSPLNHATAAAAVADLLWEGEPAKARSLITSITIQFAAEASRIDPRDPEYYRINEQVRSGRQRAAEMIARHDLKLALSFLRATRPPEGSQQVDPPGQLDAESQLELSLTVEHALSDSSTAVAAAEASLAKGISYQLVNLCFRLESTNPDAAARLEREIVDKLRSTDILSSQEAATVTANLIAHGWQQSQAQDRMRAKATASGSESFTFDKANFVSLLEIAGDAAASIKRPSETSAGASLLRQLTSVMPAFERYLPAKAAQVRAKLSQFEAVQNDQTRTWERYQNLVQTQPTTASLMDFVAALPAHQRDQFYSVIAYHVLESGDSDRAQEIIAKEVANPVQRSQTLREFDRQRAVKAAARGSNEQFRTLFEAIPTNDERFAILLRCAGDAMQRSDSDMAKQYLEEARRLSSLSESAASLHSRIELAELYSQVDVSVAAQMIGAVFGHLNTLLSAAGTLDEFEHRGAFEEGELLIASSNEWIAVLEQCGRCLATVARKDAKQAAIAIGTLQRPEARIAVRIGMLQSTRNDLVGNRAAGCPTCA